jgi:hypothetical protein
VQAEVARVPQAAAALVAAVLFERVDDVLEHRWLNGECLLAVVMQE